jgi:hypothetical protein
VGYPAGTATAACSSEEEREDVVRRWRTFSCLVFKNGIRRTRSFSLSPSPPSPPVCRARFSAPGDRQHTQVKNLTMMMKQAGKQASKARRHHQTPPRLKGRRPTPFVRGNYIPHTCICPTAQNRQPKPPARNIALATLWVFASLVRSTVQSSCSLSAARDRTCIRGPHYLDFKRLVTSD